VTNRPGAEAPQDSTTKPTKITKKTKLPSRTWTVAIFDTLAPFVIFVSFVVR
jgi:hypothetical protein